jgi:hypothetical protein
MKKTISLLTLVLITYAAQAKIWRVNNNPGVVADFTTAQAAHNAASAGDIIHLEPSNTDYGSVTCTKPLTWLSIGYFLAENPGLQYAPNTGRVQTFTMNPGSGGSVLSVYCNNIDIHTGSITVERCYISTNGYGVDIPGGAHANIVIKQNYLFSQARLNGSDVVFTNNICASIVVDPGFSAIIVNNIFSQDGGVATIANSVFQNNIIRGTGFTYNFTTPVNVSYNMTAGAGGIPSGSNNIFNVDMTSVFVNHGATGTRVDKDYVLKAGSPAVGTGLDGVDRGAFGGASPFVLGLQPAIPAVTALTAPGATSEGSIQVVISAKTNQ